MADEAPADRNASADEDPGTYRGEPVHAQLIITMIEDGSVFMDMAAGEKRNVPLLLQLLETARFAVLRQEVAAEIERRIAESQSKIELAKEMPRGMRGIQ